MARQSDSNRNALARTFSYKTAFSPNPARAALHHASSLVVPVEYNKASVDRSTSWNPSTSISGMSCVELRVNVDDVGDAVEGFWVSIICFSELAGSDSTKETYEWVDRMIKN